MKTFMNFLTENMTGKEQKEIFFQLFRLIEDLAKLAMLKAGIVNPGVDLRGVNRADTVKGISSIFATLSLWQQLRFLELLQEDILWRRERMGQYAHQWSDSRIHANDIKERNYNLIYNFLNNRVKYEENQ